MIDFVLILFVKAILWLRYRVRVSGLDKIIRKGTEGILFLPNHPALIDPIIIVSYLMRPFRVRALADQVQIDRFVIRGLARRFGVVPIPDITREGTASTKEVRKRINECIDILRQGNNLLLYPSGHIYRQYLEEIGGNSAVERILRKLPDIRVVLVRTRGLWGSDLSWASGRKPLVARTLWKGVSTLPLNGIFFCPRRRVDIELFEPGDLPRNGPRRELNQYLENYYNENAQGNTYVPYTIWEKAGSRVLAEPKPLHLSGEPNQISPATRRLVSQYLEGLTGSRDFTDQTRLAHDLGMDSLAQMELILWLESEFGFAQSDVDSLQTVGDVMLAACGEAVCLLQKQLKAVPPLWFHKLPRPHRPDKLGGMTITDAFLAQARISPNKVIIADQVSGVKTYRDMILAIMVLKKEIEKFPGGRIGIMLPASVAANILFLATLFAGKTPVMINWTLGTRNLLHSMKSIGVDYILTAQSLVSKIKSGGIELNDIGNSFVYLEDIGKKISKRAKIIALFRCRFCWSDLDNACVPETAVILFTSGSESIPKAVPLTHKNMLTNISDAYECFTIKANDCLLGILPPFHSFGLTVSMLLPLCLALRAVYYPNPTDGATVAQMIEAYKITILIGTPTFLNGIIRAANQLQLASMRLAVSGAEKCPARIYQMLERHCPQTVVLEGYGVTECSPIISVNHQDEPYAGTIGRVMSSLEYALVEPENNSRVGVNENGMLLVRGPSVFAGYINYDGPTPFVTFEGKKWYRTGDLISEDEKGILTFNGRLKRFIKLGGEMISLPAIESVLESHYTSQEYEGPVLAVVATPCEDRPEIVLFTVKDIDRQQANQKIRDEGLSGLHNIRQVIRVDQLPVLGTGKVHYQALTKKLP